MKRLKVRRRLFTKIVAGAGYHRLLSGSRGAPGEEGVTAQDSNAEAVELWNESGGEGTAPDHLDVLLAYILQFPNVIAAIASDDEVESVLAGQHVIDFASWLRHARLPVTIDSDGFGSICMNELIRHQQECKVAHAPITASDRADWPHITRKDAGTLTDSQIRLGLTEAKAAPVNYKAAVFGDSQRMRIKYRELVSLSADGKLLAAAIDCTIVVWRLQDGLTVQRLERDGHTNTIRQVAFSPDSQHIVSGANDQLALVWNFKTGDVVHRLEGHENWVLDIAFSPDGTQIAIRSHGSLRLWAASSGDLLHAITDLESKGYFPILFSPDGSRIAARSDASPSDTAVAVLDCRTGERVATLHKQDIRCMAFAPESDRIATGSEDGSLCVWAAASGEALLELKEHTDWVQEVALSPDGSEVATASDDGTVVTCDSRTGKRRFTFRAERVESKGQNRVRAVAYSPRNSFIACGADDGCVRVWDHTSGAFIAMFQGHTDDVRRVMFTPDGWGILSYGYDDEVVRLWSVHDALRLS